MGLFVASLCFTAAAALRGSPAPRALHRIALQRPQGSRLSVAVKAVPSMWGSEAVRSPETEAFAAQRVRRTLVQLLLPAAGVGVAALYGFAPAASFLRSSFGISTLAALSGDQGQFMQNFLSVIGILFSLLIGNTYYFCYNQQVMIFMAFFEEVAVAKALLEQCTLVCRGRPNYGQVLDHVSDYVERDLKRIDLQPAVLLSSKPRDDPLEAIMWMTSVGTPSVIYDTVKWLRIARGTRLGAMQRKLPPIHFALLFMLGALELCAFPLLSAGASETVGVGVLRVEAAMFVPSPRRRNDAPKQSAYLRNTVSRAYQHGIFMDLLHGSSIERAFLSTSVHALMAAAIALTLGVVVQLWKPRGSAYSVDGVLADMLTGLREDIAARRARCRVFAHGASSEKPFETAALPLRRGAPRDAFRAGRRGDGGAVAGHGAAAGAAVLPAMTAPIKPLATIFKLLCKANGCDGGPRDRASVAVSL